VPKKKIVLPGEPWKEDFHYCENIITVWKDRIAILLALAFVILLFLITIYAMNNHNPIILDKIIRIDEAGLAASAIWAFGKAVLKVLSGWRDHNLGE